MTKNMSGAGGIRVRQSNTIEGGHEMEKIMIDLVVTRHPGLVEFLRERGLCAPGVKVISHASPEDVRGKNVCGVLPHSLSCLCESFTEVPLALPAELRGVELSLEQVRQYASEPATYIVRRKS